MELTFLKMHGAGNDFVMIENLDGSISLSEKQIAALCHRQFGVGADGLMLLEKDPQGEYDARMIYHNTDGSRAEMCGNGARCFTAFALEHGCGDGEKLRFLSDAGPITATATGNLYTIELTPPAGTRTNIPITLREGPAEVHYSDTGVPHVVRFVPDIQKVDIRPAGSELRFHPEFAPRGANANFVQIQNPGEPLLIRTYERGVEDETLACGTGVTAAAILAHLVHQIPKPVSVQVAGGDVLRVDFAVEGDKVLGVTLTGPAVKVFTGTITL
ncbi:MAG: diaminopimelate epimerase [Opitutales bacterium]|nr:diaminopimelate epimerase [Opitutales bacterium]